MNLRFIWVGKTKDKNWLALQQEYLKRLSFFARCEIREVKEAREANAREIEGKRILETLNQKTFAVLLDVSGRQLTSSQLASELEKWQIRSIKEAAFVVGGVEGVSELVAERADTMLSLSILTFTHEMARVILLEQLYRAFTIIKGFPYQK